MRKETTPVDLNSVQPSPAMTPQKAAPRRADTIPPIVGIGASAGGLEALEHFLENVPTGCGIGFVIVQHPDPTRKDIVPELLQRNSAMPVVQAVHGNKVKPNCVYVIPPDKEVSISRGTLQLRDPIEPRGQRLPVDHFLRSLAEDRRELAVGVVLSGMGFDGALGLKAIKDYGGATLVQEPTSAKFDAMPRSAIDAGLADVVAPPETLPAKIIALQSGIAQRSHPHPVQSLEQMLEGESRRALEKIVAMLHHRTGNDFSLYKRNTIYRRIARRIGVHRLSGMSGYERYLRKNPQEVDILFKEMLIGVSSFFRDPAVWEHLKKDALAALLAAYPGGKVLRAWVPACSTGEEAYSLAIVFKEALEQAKPKSRFSLQIFATDLDHDAIDKARQGFFSGRIADDVSPERLRRFFIADGSSYRVSDDIRKMIVFAQQNIAMDPPFTKLDILTCRNLFIYLEPEMQTRLIPLFHYALNSGGLLLLGGAETIGSHRGLFSVLDSKARLYRRIEGPTVQSFQLPARSPSAKVPMSTRSREGTTPLTLQLQADRFLLQNYSPAAVLVNRDGDILYVNGRTGKYLEPAAGKTNWNVYAMAREGLRHELADALKKAIQQQGAVTISGLQVIQNQGEIQTVDLTVRTIDKPDALEGFVMIIFTDVEAPAPETAARRLPAGADRAELLRAREEIQALRNEMQLSNADMVAANEELQATNEALNTSKEEMQSLNEGLQTVNAELMSRIASLSSKKNDMKNLLNSVDIATIFLDSALQVRRFTEKSTQIFKLIAADVGRLLSDIVSDLQYPELQEDARAVLNTLKYSEKRVPARDGRWFKVCIMPYRTFENVIDGLVLTFADIGAFKALETELRINQIPAPPKIPIDGS